MFESRPRKFCIPLMQGVVWRCRIIILAVIGIAAGPTETPSHCFPRAGGLEELGACVDNSWLGRLAADPDQASHAPNKYSRQVFSGHYVKVLPTPLPDPYLVIFSMEVLEFLGLTAEECQTAQFVRVFSGDAAELPAFQSSWATPYALSIYGQEQYHNCPFQTGNGYGDGRAISLAEVVVNGSRWELQLKGSGTTPFCRGGDGRAVLRSSIREFLASEAMYHLGVPTTRALSLVASGSETVSRPWYSDDDDKDKSQEEEDVEKHGGDIHQHEPCAMTTRVAPSFIRVGHFELFARRARKGDAKGKKELKKLARHALFRDYPHVATPGKSFQRKLLDMAEEAAERFASLAADWLRVGYTQSNFNSDNCLVSGTTVDYGPFGFIERYDPGWGMWIGSGDHFAFMNQPSAAGRNFEMFAQSLVPLLDQKGASDIHKLVNGFDKRAQDSVNKMISRKLGLQDWSEYSSELWQELEVLLNKYAVDYTIFWRQLSELPGKDPNSAQHDLLEPLSAAFYDDLPSSSRFEWAVWISKWLHILAKEARSQLVVSDLMRRASPKYVPREWMLVEAYRAAEKGNHSLVHMLHELFKHPYDEQPSYEHMYYRRAPEGTDKKGGVGFMS